MSPVILGIVGIVIVALGVFTWRAPRLSSVILWALVAATLLSSAILLTMPVKFSELAVWLTLVMPLIWVGFQFWCYWEKRAWRVASSLIVISVASLGVVLTTAPPV